MRSSIVGQRKPQAFKRKNKKHNTNRRYSEGESSDYESKTDAISKSNTKSSAEENKAKAQIQSSNKHDSGVDFSDGSAVDTCLATERKGKKKQQQESIRKHSIDLEFKCGMIFDIEM